MDDRLTEGEGARPEIANPEAAQRVGDAARDRIAASLDSTGKALALLAGLGAFFIGAGYFVEWQRFRQGRLPSEQVLPLMPKDQIAAAGARELAISVLFVGLSLFLLGFVIFRLARWANGRQGRLPRTLNRILSRDIAFPTAIIGGLTLLIVPFGVFGVLVTAILTGLFLYGLMLIRRFLATDGSESFPLWRLVLAVGLAAIVLAGARQAEFGETRPDTLVCLSDGTSFEGDYIASDSDKVLIRKRGFLRQDVTRPEVEERELDEKRRIGLACAGEKAGSTKTQVRRRLGKRPRLVVVPRDEVEEILLARVYSVLPYETSLLDRVTSALPGLPEIPLTCIPPECRWNEQTRIGPSSYL